MIETILADPNYFAIALAILGLIGGGLLSWLITLFYFKKSQSRKLLCFSTRDSDYLGYRRADFHNLTVRYGEKQLANPVRYTLYVWNCGNLTINRADVSSIDPLKFGHNNLEILELTPIWSTRESINCQATIEITKTKIIVDFDFLDPGDGFAVQLLADRLSEKAAWNTRIQCSGTIKGLNRAPFHVAAGFDPSSWWSTYIAVAASLFFAFSAFAIFYDAWLAGVLITGLVKILAGIIFGIISIAIIGITFEGYRDRAYIIPPLLRSPKDSTHSPPSEGSETKMID